VTPQLILVCVLALFGIVVGLFIFRAGKTQQAKADADKTTDDVLKAQTVDQDVSALSDADVAARLRDSWTRKEP
jgi:hypothetical protein